MYNHVAFGSSKSIRPGSVLNVALDLDNYAVYYGLDGEWLIGNPVTSQEGKTLKKGRDYVPAIEFYSRENVASQLKTEANKIAQGTWIGRFSTKDFIYPPPRGYLPYDSTR